MSDLSMIRDKIVDTLKAVEPNLTDVRLTDTTTLADLKLDSLRLIELGVLLEDSFGKGVRFDEWLEQERARGGTEAYSLESLIAFVSKAARV